MRKVKGHIGLFALAALGVGLALQGTASAQQMVAQGTGQVYEPAGEAITTDCDCGCAEQSCGQCGCCGHQGCIAKYRAKWAAVGAANCSCRGSYKYPVPPQYTYHWPGMYSAQTMTQYASPYRFPPLKLPPSAQMDEPSNLNVGPAGAKPLESVGYSH